MSDSQHAIACSESDKSAQGRDELISGLRVAYGDADPVGPQAGKGLAAAYGETVLPQGEADPARFPISAYAARVDQNEGSLGLARNLEAYPGQFCSMR